VRPTEENVSAISKTEAPTNITGQYYFPVRYRDDCGTKWHWGKEENKAFETLKNQLAWTSMKTFYNKEAKISASHRDSANGQVERQVNTSHYD